ncbi:MAG: hypothetical protein FWD26_01890 [Treponema sp.]|nr:hypothetical protein [Treponema sp.]
MGSFKNERYSDVSPAEKFLVLVPHRDTRVELQKYSEMLLKSGLKNVYKFPQAAPLAALSKPLTSNELKNIARSLREAALIRGISGEMFHTKELSTVTFPDKPLFGPRLDLGTRELSINFKTEKIISLFSPAIIGLFLNCSGVSAEPHKLSFRAAAVANMYWKPVKSGYKWKIGKLHWLPKTITY